LLQFIGSKKLNITSYFFLQNLWLVKLFLHFHRNLILLENDFICPFRLLKSICFAYSVHRMIIFVRFSKIFHFVYGLHFFSFLLLMLLLSFLSFIHIWNYLYFISIKSYWSCYSLFSRIHFFSVTLIYLSSFVLNSMYVVSFFPSSLLFYQCLHLSLCSIHSCSWSFFQVLFTLRSSFFTLPVCTLF